LARWDEGYQYPWLIVTDLAPEFGDVLWYSLRELNVVIEMSRVMDGSGIKLV
jgi:hypothetical protein